MITYSPLDQFRITSFCYLHLGSLDVSFTNAAFMILLMSFAFVHVVQFGIVPFEGLKKKTVSFLNLNNRWLLVVQHIYIALFSLVVDNVGKQGEKYFPFFFSLLIFLLSCNLVGLVPYTFTATSHIYLTLTLALIIFIGVNIIGVKKHKKKIFRLFLPSGTGFPLAFLLVPLECVSFFAKPISLSVRLFANMMAGHTLLKVIANFAWTMMTGSFSLLLAHFIPLILLFLLIGLELGVAFIQAYVFTLLSCIYLNDSIHLH